jgi:hypothetical protein
MIPLLERIFSSNGIFGLIAILSLLVAILALIK